MSVCLGVFYPPTLLNHNSEVIAVYKLRGPYNQNTHVPLPRFHPCLLLQRPSWSLKHVKFICEDGIINKVC